MRRGPTPYQQLGRRLGDIRRRLQETLPEVSGAVEIETESLSRYENGEARPSEEILMLLISHFGIRDNEADELWDLAGYSNPATRLDDLTQLPTLVMMPSDNRIVYTDSANVSINNSGVVMNFMQTGLNSQPAAISRVGMSLAQAKNVLEVLTKTIEQAEVSRQPKTLSAPKKAKSKKRTSK